jgi:SAM-dependent methyltransferase
MAEIDEIERRYRRRNDTVLDSDKSRLYSEHFVEERERIYKKVIQGELKDISASSLLEVGAGTGFNMPFFLRAGFRAENITANELLPDRIRTFRERFPAIRMLPGNVLDMAEAGRFDVVFQSTVFSSVLDEDFRRQLAAKMMRLLKPGGIILSYDFVYNNPFNPDVKQLTRDNIKQLFPHCSYAFYKVTLAPPIGRRIPHLYTALNTLFPFLRSHLVAVIRQCNAVQRQQDPADVELRRRTASPAVARHLANALAQATTSGPIASPRAIGPAIPS